MWKLWEIAPVFFILKVTLPHGIAPPGLSWKPISNMSTLTVVFFGCAHFAAVAADALPPTSAETAATPQTASVEPATTAGRSFIGNCSFRQRPGSRSFRRVNRTGDRSERRRVPPPQHCGERGERRRRGERRQA